MHECFRAVEQFIISYSIILGITILLLVASAMTATSLRLVCNCQFVLPHESYQRGYDGQSSTRNIQSEREAEMIPARKGW